MPKSNNDSKNIRSICLSSYFSSHVHLVFLTYDDITDIREFIIEALEYLDEIIETKTGVLSDSVKQIKQKFELESEQIKKCIKKVKDIESEMMFLHDSKLELEQAGGVVLASRDLVRLNFEQPLLAYFREYLVMNYEKYSHIHHLLNQLL